MTKVWAASEVRRVVGGFVFLGSSSSSSMLLHSVSRILENVADFFDRGWIGFLWSKRGAFSMLKENKHIQKGWELNPMEVLKKSWTNSCTNSTTPLSDRFSSFAHSL